MEIILILSLILGSINCSLSKLLLPVGDSRLLKVADLLRQKKIEDSLWPIDWEPILMAVEVFRY